MQLKAQFFLNGHNKENDSKTSFVFKLRDHLPLCTKLEHLEKDLINIINSVKLKSNTKNLLKKLRPVIY